MSLQISFLQQLTEILDQRELETFDTQIRLNLLAQGGELLFVGRKMGLWIAKHGDEQEGIICIEKQKSRLI